MFFSVNKFLGLYFVTQHRAAIKILHFKQNDNSVSLIVRKSFYWLEGM